MKAAFYNKKKKKMQKDSTETVNSPRSTTAKDVEMEINEPQQVLLIVEELVEQLCVLKHKLVDMIQVEDQICVLCRRKSRPKIRIRKPRTGIISSFKITSDDNTGEIKEIICEKSDNDSYGPENFELEPVNVSYSKSNHSITIEKQESHITSNASEVGTKPNVQSGSILKSLSNSQNEQWSQLTKLQENSLYGPETFESDKKIRHSLSQTHSKTINSDVHLPSVILRKSSHTEYSSSEGQILQSESKEIPIATSPENISEPFHRKSSDIASRITSPRASKSKQLPSLKEDSKIIKDTVQVEDIPVIISDIAKNKSAKEFFVAILAEVQTKVFRINVIDKDSEKLLGYFCVDDPIFQKARCDGMFDDFLSLFGLNTLIPYTDLKCGISTEAMTSFPWK